MSFFGVSNPFNSPVGQRIERATDVSLASEDWALNMEICDIINETDEGPKDAMKAIKKRLNTSVGKNYTAIIYSLTVLETCVKNCGKRFHIHVANKEFLHDLIKIIGPKNDPPQVVQEKILSLIQTWADAFRGVPELKEVEKVYTDLKSKGIEFPMTDLDSLAPIHTPARSAPESEPSVAVRQPSQRPASARQPTQPTVAQPAAPQPAGQYQPPTAGQYPPPTAGQYPPPTAAPVQPVYATGPVTPTMEQLGKLRSEIDIVRGNVRVFGEMLTELTPGQENREDWQLLQELNNTCRQMQQRIVELIERVQNEEVTEELLIVNDELNNIFIRYDRYERARSGPTNTSQADTLNAPPPSYPTEPEPVSSDGVLIDLGSPPVQSSQVNPLPPLGLEPQLADMAIGGNRGNPAPVAPSTGNNDDFDMFAQSRQSFDQNRQNAFISQSYDNQRDNGNIDGGLVSAVNVKADPSRVPDTHSDSPQDKDRDYDEMEEWLKTNSTPNNPENNTQVATSSEFDRFLAERAAAAETLPPISSNQTEGQRSTNQPRKIQSDDENALFAL